MLVGVGNVDDVVALVPFKFPDNDVEAVAIGASAVIASGLSVAPQAAAVKLFLPWPIGIIGGRGRAARAPTERSKSNAGTWKGGCRNILGTLI